MFNIEKHLQHKSCAFYRIGGCVNVQLYVAVPTENRKVTEM